MNDKAKAFRDLLISNIVKLGLKASGFAAFAYSLVLKYAYKFMFEYLRREKLHYEEKKETAKEKEKYEEIINKPGATNEEIRDAGKDFLNS
jgi:hypothetical protein